MDILAAKKEIVQAELDSSQSHLWSARENVSVQPKKVEKLESNLSSLAKDLKVAKSEVVAANTKAHATANQYKVDVEDTLEQAKGMVDPSKWKALREALKGVLDHNFNISAELEIAKVKEEKARKLAFAYMDFENVSGSGGEDFENEEASSDKDNAA